MDKIRIRQNYENYERVQKAFKEFVHALVWESMDIDAGVHEDEVNEHIAKYCRTNGDQMIALTTIVLLSSSSRLTLVLKFIAMRLTQTAMRLKKLQNISIQTMVSSLSKRQQSSIVMLSVRK